MNAQDMKMEAAAQIRVLCIITQHLCGRTMNCCYTARSRNKYQGLGHAERRITDLGINIDQNRFCAR